MVKKLAALFCLAMSGFAFADLVGGGSCITWQQRLMLELEYSQKSHQEVQLEQQLITAEAQLAELDQRIAEECPGPDCEYVTFLYNQKLSQIWGLQSSIQANNARLNELIILLGLQDCPENP